MTEISLPSDKKDAKRDSNPGATPQRASPSTPVGEPSTSFPLVHQQQTVPVEPYYDLPDDDDDVLPVLDGAAAAAAAAAAAGGDEPLPQYSDLPPSRYDIDPLGPTQPFADSLPRRSFRNRTGDTQYYMDPRLDTDADYLQRWLSHQAAYPPRPFVRIEGSHNETTYTREHSPQRGGHNNHYHHHHHHHHHSSTKTETRRVVDFDIRIELTPFLYSNIAQRQSWRTVRTADNFEKVHRGTVRQTRAVGFGGDGALPRNNNTGTTVTGTGGSLKEWCYLFCAASGLKTFRLRRRVQGLDQEWLGSRLETLVRETGYRGRVEVTFPVSGEKVDVYSWGRVNLWRRTAWVRWLFYLTLMFIFVWPYLYFCTRKWDVLYVDWDFSRRGRGGARQFVSVSEEGWLRIWENGIRKAVLGRRQGVLDQRDLALDGPSPSLTAVRGDDRAGLVGAVANAMDVVQRQFGWGGDT